MLSFLTRFSLSASTHSIAVDAGSTESRAYLYSTEEVSNFPEISLLNSTLINIKLQDAEFNASVVPALVTEIQKFATTFLPTLTQTKLLIYATGAMRDLSESTQKAIVDSLIANLRTATDFQISPSQIRVISGAEEGFYMWLAANYQRHQFDVLYTLGVLDLGGNSLQIAYDISLEHKDQSYKEIYVRDFLFNVYSHSYEELGILKLMNRIENNLSSSISASQIINPCLNTGYSITENNKTFVGKMDFQKCEEMVQNYVVNDVKSIIRPDFIKSIDMFYGFGGFSMFMNFAGLQPAESLSSIRAQSLAICQETSESIQEKAQGFKYAYTYCLQGIMIYNLVRNAFQFPNNIALMFTEEIGGSNVSWTLGAVFEPFLSQFGPKNNSNTTLIIIIVISCVVGVAFIAIFIFYILHRRKWKLDQMNNALNSKSLLGSY